MKEQTQIDTIVNEINAAVSDENLPKLYGNSFSLAMGTGDITILLKNGSKPTAIINLSYTTAKTLSVKLNDTICYLESKSGNKIMTTDDIEQVFKKEDKK